MRVACVKQAVFQFLFASLLLVTASAVCSQSVVEQCTEEQNIVYTVWTIYLSRCHGPSKRCVSWFVTVWRAKVFHSKISDGYGGVANNLENSQP